MEENINDVSSDQKESMAVPHAGPGIMLLTPSMRLLLLCFSGTCPASLILRSVVRYNVLSSSSLTVV